MIREKKKENPRERRSNGRAITLNEGRRKKPPEKRKTKRNLCMIIFLHLYAKRN
jgi:hypothetical protein